VTRGVLEGEAPAVLRLGVFGGAFDPPHRAHVALATAALQQLQLDQLRVLPTGMAWHKERPLTASAHRLAMCKLAFVGLDKLVIDPRETLRTGPTYTIDTLNELRQEYPAAQFYLLMGQDQAAALAGWHRWREIAETAIICIAARAQSTGGDGHLDPQKFGLPQAIRLQMPPLPVSATDIRDRLANDKSVSPLVFESVARYIEQHHLYLTS